VSTALTLVMAVLVIVAAGMLIGLVETARRRAAKHRFRLVWRWFSGMPHDGKTFPDSRFWERPRHHRAARRILRTTAVLLLAWGLLYHRTATLLITGMLTGAGIVYGAVRTVRWARGLRHHVVWVRPAHLVAAPLAGRPVSAGPGWLAIEPDRSRVVAELPAEYNGDEKQRQRLVETLSAKLGIESPDVAWKLAGPKPTLTLSRSEPPPKLVTLRDVRDAIEASGPDELVWGLGKRHVVVKSSLSGDSPHIGLSMGSGAGKSVTARSLLAQQLHKGAVGLILDGKMISHQWAEGLPNVAIARRPAELHRALVWLGGHPAAGISGELERRNEVALAGADIDGNVHATVGPRLFIIAEELNATIDILRAYWRDVLEEKGRSPALSALDSVSFMGRQVLMHIVYIGQALSAKAMGGGRDSTENMGVIAFARTKPRTWKMLAPDFAQPPADLTPGRLHVVSSKVESVQGVKMSGAEAREFALSGIVSPLPHGMPCGPADTAGPALALAGAHASDQGLQQFQPGNPGAPVSRVTLREAVERGLFGPLSLDGARTARHRDPTFPAAVGRRLTADEYDPEQLAAWAAGRKE
jgi:hypothetical protein